MSREHTADECDGTCSRHMRERAGKQARDRRSAVSVSIISTALYLCDNGMVLCGRHLGASARATGRDISGQPIHRMTAMDKRQWVLEAGRPVRCEICECGGGS